ncbi:MAG: M13 family metallopeptidase [Gammaproteobacteria bacterium]
MRFNRSILLGVLCAASLTAVADTSTAGLHLDWLDKSGDPSKDFFSYANGGWQKQNPIPAAYSRWGTFAVLSKQNQDVIKQILEDSAKTKNAPGSTEQKVGDFYAAGMDEQAVNAAGIKPLQSEFDAINAIKGQAGLQKEMAHLHMIGVNVMFNFGQMQDFKDSSKVIGAAFQGGLGLPDRDYYLKDDAKFKQVRDAYVTHVTNAFKLLGDAPDKAAAEARTVMGMETSLAQASMSRVDERTPTNIYHPMTMQELAAATPDISWQGYFTAVGHPEMQGINLAMPDFFKALDSAMAKTSLDDWKTYLRWHTVNAFAPYLSKPFVDEDFAMRSALTGAKELLPRWQRVVTTEDDALGFAMGKLFVEKKFPPSSKQAVVDILHGIRGALKDDLSTLAWMSPDTRKAAAVKLDLMAERIGYPDKWRDYSALDVKRDSYVQNVMRANEFLQKRELNKIGKPVDKEEWDMTPQTVNAYYDPSMNNINFPAGILQPPFFDPSAPAAVNYGALGFVMGHEMTHGFDDQGAQFDGHGNLKNWWTPDDLKKFQVATDCISNHFSQYTVDGGLHVQGKLITGEATADLGGLTLAWRAFHASKAYKDAKTIDGFTPDQQFFLGAAHVWAMNIRPEESRRLVTIDPHPPGIYRVNGTMANMPQFQQAFKVADGSPMVNKDRCVIW